MIRNKLSFNPAQLAENMIRKLKEKRGNSPSSAVLEAAIIVAFMVLALIILWWACLDDFTTNTVPVRLFWFTLIPGAVLYQKHFRYCYDMQHWTSRTMYMEYWNWIKQGGRRRRRMEEDGRRSCCFDEPCICQLNYLLHYDCLNEHETQSLLDHQKNFWAVRFSTTFYFTVKNICTRKGK